MTTEPNDKISTPVDERDELEGNVENGGGGR